MDSRAFLGLQQTHNPYRWHLPVDRRLCTGGNFLYGGTALGAAISAMEGTTGRNVIWTTAQYLSYARPGEVMDIDVIVPVEGNAITQARVVGHVGEREIITVNAALGDRNFEHSGQFVTAPEAGRPEEYENWRHRHISEGTIHDFMEERVVKARSDEELDGTPGDGKQSCGRACRRSLRVLMRQLLACWAILFRAALGKPLVFVVAVIRSTTPCVS